MAISSSIAIYFVLWWVVLFAVLPFGSASSFESPGMATGKHKSSLLFAVEI
jgi:predicted secreted protein